MRTEDMNYAFYNEDPANVIWFCAYSRWTLLMESWTSSERGPGPFLSTLTVICNSVKSQSDIFHFLFTSGQNRIKILLVSCRERCWRVGVCSEGVCVYVCNSCKEEQQARWHQLLCSALFSCSLTSLCLFVSPCLFLSLSLESGFCFQHTLKWISYLLFEELRWMIS